MGKRSVLCPICSKVLRSNKQLMSHLETHDDANNPFPCDICKKNFKNLLCLNIHMKTHGLSRDYQCTICDRAFTNASHLRRHLNSHTGKKLIFGI